MTESGHSELGPELRQLAQAILDRLDPAVRAAAAMAGDALRSPGRCQQVWCPVCALAALVSGEQHPLLTVVAEHSVTLMTVIQSMVDESRTSPAEAAAPAPVVDESADETADETAGGPPSSSSVRFHHIPIVIESDTDA